MSETVKSCEGIPLPVFTIGKVESVGEVTGAIPKGSVWLLNLNTNGDEPLSGQFYLLKSKKSGVLLGRPISVYSSKNENGKTKIGFMILKKGKGTEELVNLSKDDEVELIVPLGNIFPEPKENAKIAIIGGGIGVAPVAGFASSLKDESYDFFAAFKSGSYGLDFVKAKNLVITTDDGSVGVKGMLSAAFNEENVKNYDVVYACGPTPMLAYIQKVCVAKIEHQRLHKLSEYKQALE